MSNENLYKSHKDMCKSLKYYKPNCDVTSLLNAPEDVHNQECSPLSCAACGRKENIEKCDRCHLVGYCSKFCQHKNWYKHKQNCLQNHGIVEIQTDGHKKLRRETHVEHIQSTILQSPFNHAFDSAPKENYRIYGPYVRHRSDCVDFSIRKSLFRNINGIVILFEIGFLSLPLLGLLLLIGFTIGFFFFYVVCLF